MRSSSPQASTDLTARARIIAAALDCCASRGCDTATLREIADAAGTSPALVVHHFGGKQGLLRACDERVIAFVDGKRRADLPAVAVLGEATTHFGPYAARRLAHAGEGSAALFDGLLAVARAAVTEGVASGELRTSVDPEGQAVALLVLGLAPFAFTGQLERWASAPPDAALARLAVPLAEIYTRGVYARGGVLDAAVRQSPPQQQPTQERSQP